MVFAFFMCVFVVLWPLIVFAKKHPVNLIILMLFTLTISFAVGLCCSFSKGMVTEIRRFLHYWFCLYVVLWVLILSRTHSSCHGHFTILPWMFSVLKDDEKIRSLWGDSVWNLDQDLCFTCTLTSHAYMIQLAYFRDERTKIILTFTPIKKNKINFHWYYNLILLQKKNREDCSGGSDSHSYNGPGVNDIHFLGSKERPWLLFPWTIPLRSPPYHPCLLYHTGNIHIYIYTNSKTNLIHLYVYEEETLKDLWKQKCILGTPSSGEAIVDDIQLFRFSRVLRLHCLRHESADQETQLRRVYPCCYLSLSRRHQSLPPYPWFCHPHLVIWCIMHTSYLLMSSSWVT